jgi:signal transduction histidine kinase
MQKDLPHYRWIIAEVSLSIVVLFILLFFTYGIFIGVPYAGFQFNPNDGSILVNYVDRGSTPTLQAGDILLKVGSVSFREYKADSRQSFFKGVKVGDFLDIVVQRDNTQVSISRLVSGFNQEEFNSRFFNVWWLGYIFWIFGTTIILFMRPRDSIRRLLAASNYLTGLFLISGSMSASHLWESSILLHVFAWLILPIYLHLHWIFPKPLHPTPKWLAPVLYAVCCLFAIAETMQAPPRWLYALVFLFALIGSAVLQGIHFVRRPEQQREIGFLAVSILLVIAPLISLLISGASSKIAFLTFFALPFLPLSYFYVIYRRQIGGLVLRTNKLVSAYAFLILIGAGLLLLLQPAEMLQISRQAAIFLIVVVTLLVALLSITVFPKFQAWVEQRFLGIKLPYQNLQELYSSRIAASTAMPGLLQLLEEQVFPSLLIRQYAFIQVSNRDLKALLTKNIPEEKLPAGDRINDLVERGGQYIPELSENDEWMRLILPLRVGDSFIGFWLLGSRDPDDLYAPTEIPILQSIASQTAIALSNLVHGEQLRKMYQSDIERYEKERMRLARELHDSILNELAVLRNNLDEDSFSPRFQASYEEVIHRLREIVSDLRPPMLMYGLKPAIEGLADNLMERGADKIKITVDIQSGQERYPQNIEQHLYRIVQEACENTLRHSRATQITISGKLMPEYVQLLIEDNGAGFQTGERIELDDLLAGNHFGLVGMVERGTLIGAEVEINSSTTGGAQIKIILNTVHEKAVQETSTSMV